MFVEIKYGLFLVMSLVVIVGSLKVDYWVKLGWCIFVCELVEREFVLYCFLLNGEYFGILVFVESKYVSKDFYFCCRVIFYNMMGIFCVVFIDEVVNRMLFNGYGLMLIFECYFFFNYIEVNLDESF